MNTLVMVGAGGTGTMLLRPLVRYMSVVDPEFRLYIIDGDHVEAKNLERQDFGLSQVSMNKAVAALDLFGDPENMVAVPEYLSEDNMERYIADGDIVLICADNFTVRKRIEEHCMKLQHCAVINGGNETYSGSVQI